MKIPDHSMTMVFSTPFEHMPDDMPASDVFEAMYFTAAVLYHKPRAKRQRWIFLRGLVKESRRRDELLPIYDTRYAEAHP